MAPKTSTQPIRVLQTNTNRSIANYDLVSVEMAEREVDVLVDCEPNKKLVASSRWITDNRSDVAVLIKNRNLAVNNIKKKDSYVIISFKQFDLVAVYISPNITHNESKNKIDEIMNNCRNLSAEYVLMGDLNAKSIHWGSPITDPRGDYLTDWMASLDMIVNNKGNKPTFIRGNTKSYIDVTSSSRGLARDITNWEIIDTGKEDHQYIYFEINKNIKNKKPIEKTTVKVDWDTFKKKT